MTKSELATRLVLSRKINIKKIVNLLRGLWSYYNRNIIFSHYPSILMIEPTNYCNLKCPLCATGYGTLTRKQGMIEMEVYRKIIDKLGDYLLNLTLWNCGEPFMHPQICKMIKMASERRIFTRISTNGHFFQNIEAIEQLLATNLDMLIVSLDGASEETFSKYRKKGDFDQVVAGIERLINIKRQKGLRNPFVELQFMVMEHNEHEISIIQDIATQLGVDKCTLKTVNTDIGDLDYEKYLPQNGTFSRYRKGTNVLRDFPNDCFRIWLSAVINWDGMAVPCCLDPNGDYSMGNFLENEDFFKLWNGDLYRRFRESILKDKQSIPMCKNCPGKIGGILVK